MTSLSLLETEDYKHLLRVSTVFIRTITYNLLGLGRSDLLTEGGVSASLLHLRNGVLQSDLVGLLSM